MSLIACVTNPHPSTHSSERELCRSGLWGLYHGRTPTAAAPWCQGRGGSGQEGQREGLVLICVNLVRWVIPWIEFEKWLCLLLWTHLTSPAWNISQVTWQNWPDLGYLNPQEVSPRARKITYFPFPDSRLAALGLLKCCSTIPANSPLVRLTSIRFCF